MQSNNQKGSEQQSQLLYKIKNNYQSNFKYYFLTEWHIWIDLPMIHWLTIHVYRSFLYLFMIFLPFLLFLHMLFKTWFPVSLEHTNTGLFLNDLNRSKFLLMFKTCSVNPNAYRSFATRFHIKSSSWAARLLWIPHILQSEYSKHIPLFCWSGQCGSLFSVCSFFL